MSVYKNIILSDDKDKLQDVTSTSKKLETFRRLQPGWHYGGGCPITDEVYKRSRRMHDYLLALGFVRMDAFPGVVGEIMVTAYVKDHYIEVVIEPDGSFSLRRERGQDEIFFELELSESRVKAELRGMAKDIWSMSDLSAPSTTIHASKGSTDLPSRTCTEAFQSSAPSVFPRVAARFVYTSPYIMHDGLQASLPYFGGLEAAYSRRTK